MKRWMILMLGLAALWSGPSAQAQEKDEALAPAFIDENGDGIDDRETFRHRQSRRLGGSALLSVLSAQLTKAQRTALQAKINELLSGGATPDQIQDAVFAELESFGVDLTATFLGQFETRLTADQMAALRTRIDALKAEGASYMDIHRALHSELADLGIDWGERKPDHFGSLMTRDQMTELQKKIDGLVADGASRTDIQKAIDAEMEALGIDLPTMRGGPGSSFWNDRRRGPRGHDGRGGPPRPPSKESDKAEK